jgi:hypothetical protein
MTPLATPSLGKVADVKIFTHGGMHAVKFSWFASPPIPGANLQMHNKMDSSCLTEYIKSLILYIFI